MRIIRALAFGLSLIASLVGGCGKSGSGDDNASPAVPFWSPLLDFIKPAVGPSEGGILMTLDGHGFTDGFSVTVAGAAATQPALVSLSRIRVTLPASAGRFGKVPVTVTNADGLTVTRDDLFAYQPPIVPVGAGPLAIVSADLNGDGNADLATADNGSSTVSILFGDGNGAFLPAKVVTLNEHPIALSTADFNCDGLADLAVISSDDKQTNADLSVILGESAGNFVVKKILGSELTHYWALATGDWNRDGNADLAITSNGGLNSLLLGDGAGSFAPPTYCSWGNHSNWLVGGDVNGDGNPDLVVNDYGIINTCLGDGTGQFVRGAMGVSAMSARMPSSAILSDLNGDSRADLVISDDQGDAVTVLLNNGAAGLGVATDFKFDTKTAGVAVGDLDGDSKPDLIVTNPDSNSVSLLRGDGAGGFAAWESFMVGTNPVAVTLGDWNGDRQPDLAVANNFDGTISLLWGPLR